MANDRPILIKGPKATACERLREWANRDEPLRFVLAVLASRPMVIFEADPQEWLVPSMSCASE